MTTYSPIYTDSLEVHAPDSAYDSLFPRRIQTDRLHLQYLVDDVSVEEATSVYKKNRGTDQYYNTTFGIPQTYQDTLDSFADIESMRANHDDMFYSIRDATGATGDFIGQATIEDVDLRANRCGIGLWLRQSVWGQGLAQELAEGLLYAIFTEMPIDTVEIRVATDNQKSINSVLKFIQEFGGTFEGRLRNMSVNPQRERISIYIWTITQDEFMNPESEYTEDIPSPTRQ